jgi:hypothetical protein
MRIDPVIVNERDTLGQLLRGLDNGITAGENLGPEGTAGQTLTSNGASEPPSFRGGVGSLVYGHSISVDMRVCTRCKITVTDGIAFTIQNPTNPIAGPTLTFDIVNAAGGAIGTITWNDVYKLAGVFTNPSSGSRKTISFYYDGSAFIELSRAGADIV